MNGAFEDTHLVVDLNPRAVAIADIDETIFAHGHAVHDVHALWLPLAEELSARIDHGNAAIAARTFSIGHVHITIPPIDGDTRWHEEDRRIRIERCAFNRSVGGIHHPLLSDLQQQLASVVCVFLHHAGGRARDPDVVVLVRVAGVEPWIEQRWITPGIDHVAFNVELDDRWRESARVQLAIENVLPVEDEHVILRIDAGSAQASEHPAIGQRLRPVDVGFIVRRRAGLRVGEVSTDERGRDSEDRARAGADEAS